MGLDYSILEKIYGQKLVERATFKSGIKKIACEKEATSPLAPLYAPIIESRPQTAPVSSTALFLTQGPKDDTEKSRKIAELTTKLVLKTRQLEKANKKVNRLTTSVQSLEHERMRAWPNSPPKLVESNDSTRELKALLKR